MIRKLTTITDKQLDTIMAIWLKSTSETHSYIDQTYWQSKKSFVRQSIKEADIYIYEVDNSIKGFVGLQENYIAGIFVEKNVQRKGIGERLLKKVKQHNQTLTLAVYKKNTQALCFYKKQGFSVIDERIDSDTNEIEYVMCWLDTKLKKGNFYN